MPAKVLTDFKVAKRSLNAAAQPTPQAVGSSGLLTIIAVSPVHSATRGRHRFPRSRPPPPAAARRTSGSAN